MMLCSSVLARCKSVSVSLYRDIHLNTRNHFVRFDRFGDKEDDGVGNEMSSRVIIFVYTCSMVPRI